MISNKIICSIVAYLVIGLVIWLEIKTQNYLNIKMHVKPKYKEPYVLKITLFWLPLYLWATVKDIWAGINYITKKLKRNQ